MSDPTCNQCDYELAGLRRSRGTCPECGQYFNLLSGEGVAGRASDRHRRGERFAARLRTVLLGLLAVGLMGCGGLLSLAASDPLVPLLSMGLIAAVAGLAAVVSFLSERDSSNG